eukprot:TRINITY_DN42040_c0_g1_i1.p1 TRINITY_DN42040_c0_g1~~TRINITY_DN42040_c0_g1_i1.p1  ORF type:complete len:266 (+),score=118.83 TRINITY_DN42040_c0_g1_i1:102-800(+)
MNANENLSPVVMARLMREIRSLCEDPPEGIRVQMDEHNMANITAEIDGPAETPFFGGRFKIRLVLGPDFPQSPPKGYVVTKIFHPNVSDKGEICVNTLKKDWKPSLGLRHVLLVIRCLLIVPNPESALNPEAGKLLLEDYDAYKKRAEMMTRIHAKPKHTRKHPDTPLDDDDDDDGGIASSSSSSSSSKLASSSSSSSSSAATALTPSKKLKSAAKKKRKTGAKKKKGLKRL